MMTNEPDNRFAGMSRAARALMMAQQAVSAQRQDAASPTSSGSNQSAGEDNWRFTIAEHCLWEMLDLRELTFIAYFTIGKEPVTDVGPSLPSAVDLALHLCYGRTVNARQLAQSVLRVSIASPPSANAADVVNGWIPRLRDADIEYVLAWHVHGETEIHLDHSLRSESEAINCVRNCLLAEVRHQMHWPVPLVPQQRETR
ncbi:MAG: hypothetical protein H6822_24110 [Planctomycetaceae bacterium]|nr:hypothetical protein [Planctomycetaceae bacterium]